ncbi:beta-galactosidase GalB [Niabella terrae]
MKQLLILILLMSWLTGISQRSVQDFNRDWKFRLEDDSSFRLPGFNDNGWRRLNLPHDWSIEGKFDSTWPAGNAGGALPGGVGWYRKTFTFEANPDRVYIDFDGVYQNSEVWINGHYLGKWPYGYTAFRYELTPWLSAAGQNNLIAVRVDNSLQPNSRWYTGSGIYRDVKLISTGKTALRQWGVFVTTPQVSTALARVAVAYELAHAATGPLRIESKIIDAAGKTVSRTDAYRSEDGKFYQELEVRRPELWSVNNPYRYQLLTRLYQQGRLVDEVRTPFGIRYFNFDAKKGFSLNGQPMKILGVCQHHDLGALGAAFNRSAARRQLRILKEMGVNAIRMAHNPPAAALLDLCDEMGFLVMDESFDQWAKRKNKFDYHLDFIDWHRRDLEHMVRRDRNHPSVIAWSIGNEIREQFDSSGIRWTRELVRIVKDLDTTRPVTVALTENDPAKNYIYQSGALDLLGFNYKIDAYKDLAARFPGEKIIATENVSGLASRGHYDMPADSMRYWPSSSAFKYVQQGNPDYTVSAYDNVAAYWGVSHEANWREIKKYDYIAGLFVWSGFDFLGEPVPYPFPARSSYYGIVDLSGFPKDVYYMYQSEWTDQPVLHLFPHWNWTAGQLVDVSAYYSQADEVELFLNGRSLGKRHRSDTSFHVRWRVPFQPGTLSAVSYKKGKKVLERQIRTAGPAYRLVAETENPIINSRQGELAFIELKVVDRQGNLVPDADPLVQVRITGPAGVAGMDNGYPADLHPMQDAQHHVYKGRLLTIIRGRQSGKARIQFTASGLQSAVTEINIQ